MRTRKPVLAQKSQQIDFAANFAFALDLVDPQQEFALGGLDQVVRIYRAFGNPGCTAESPEIVVINELFEECFAELGIDGH